MYRVKQVGNLLNLSQSKVYELIENGRIGHYRMDGAIRVSQQQIDEYLQETEQERRVDSPRKCKPRRPRVELKYL